MTNSIRLVFVCLLLIAAPLFSVGASAAEEELATPISSSAAPSSSVTVSEMRNDRGAAGLPHPVPLAQDRAFRRLP